MNLTSEVRVHSRRKRVILGIVLPFIEALLCCFHRTRKIDPATPIKRILVFRPDHIGDAIMATSVLQPLKSKYPAAYLAMCVGPWAKELLDKHPLIDELIITSLPWWTKIRKSGSAKFEGLDMWQLLRQLRKQPFDLFIDLRSDLRHILLYGVFGRSKYILAYNRTGGNSVLCANVPFHPEEHEVVKNISLLQPLGIKAQTPSLSIPVKATARISLTEKLQDKEATLKAPIVVFCPQTRLQVKEWPQSSWTELTRRLLQSIPEIRIIVVGDSHLTFPIQQDWKDSVILADGTFTLSELNALFEQAVLVIGSDSAPLHLAACRDIPILALFGPTKPEIFAPFTSKASLLVGQCVCNRDIHLDCRVNPGGSGKCMIDITVDQVAGSALSLLAPHLHQLRSI